MIKKTNPIELWEQLNEQYQKQANIVLATLLYCQKNQQENEVRQIPETSEPS